MYVIPNQLFAERAGAFPNPLTDVTEKAGLHATAWTSEVCAGD